MTAETALEKPQEPLVKIQVDDCEVTLLGTAHISRASADKVREMLQSGDYDCVAIELCYSRHRSIIDPDALAKMDLFQVVREGKATMVAASLALGAFQQRMAEKLDIKPGAEMRTAIEFGESLKMPVLLIDREIGTTLKRVYRRVGFWQRMNLVAGLMVSVVSRHEVTEDEIERLKEGDILESTFSQFAEEAKELYTPLVDERDKFMAARIKQEVRKGKHRNMLVVIGAGHLKGIARYLQHWDRSILQDNLYDNEGRMREHPAPQTDLEPAAQDTEEVTALQGRRSNDPDPVEVINHFNYIPPTSKWPKLIPWAIVALILIGFGLGFSRSSDLGWQLVADWVLINGGLAALGALLALAHPITIVGAFLAAPLTSLNPTVGAGMVTAAIETGVRKPRVEDFTRLRRDTTHIRGWWSNGVTRILLVFLFSTLGSAIGTYLAGFRILERLAF
ncbi:MAG: TraB/GumN family protein [Gammaproteobacteria bacterium]|jgi:pheromone shutdown protein TraB